MCRRVISLLGVYFLRAVFYRSSLPLILCISLLFFSLVFALLAGCLYRGELQVHSNEVDTAP